MSLFACSATVEPGEERAPVTRPHDPAAPEPAPPAAKEDGRRDRTHATQDLGLGLPSTPVPFVCRAGAFCEDFEGVPEQAVGARWSGIVRDGGGKMEIHSESASVGKNALTLFAPDVDASVFLDHAKGGVAPRWSGLLGFALKVAAVPAEQLGGPELVMKTVDGPVSVRVSLRPEGLVLEQLATETCGRERCRPSTTVIAPAKEGSWYRVRLGFEVKDQSAPPYGRIQATVDGGPVQTADLTIPLYDGSVALHAGITHGDTRRALVNLDDITLLLP